MQRYREGMVTVLWAEKRRIWLPRKIENTSWKVLAYGIYARVVDVSEIERVSAANE